MAAAWNMRLFWHLGRILETFQAAGIQTIPLKGACLAEHVYGDISLRPMGDLDLLVGTGDLGAALETIRTLRFTATSAANVAVGGTSSPHLPPMLAPDGTVVELHWTIVSPGYASRFTQDDLDGLWSRSRAATIAGVSSRTLSPTDLLLHLSIHMSAQHRFDGAGLRALVDIAETIHSFQKDLDWDAFVARANQWGVSAGIKVALLLVREWTDAAVPEDVITQLKGEPLEEEVLVWVRRKVLEGNAFCLDSDLAPFETGRGLADTLRILRRVLFPSREAIARGYLLPRDSWRTLVYYPIRWKDLLVRYRVALWKLATRDSEFIKNARNETRLREYLGWA